MRMARAYMMVMIHWHIVQNFMNADIRHAGYKT